MSKIYSIIIVLLLLALGVSFLFSHNINIQGSKSHPFSLYEKIQEGIALLKTSPPLAYDLPRSQQVALAILDQKTGEVFEKRMTITPDGDIVTEDAPISIKWWNSFNSFFEIPTEPSWIVVANKFLVERQYLPEQNTLSLVDGAPTSKYTDMVYAPYSTFLHTPEVVAAGVAYINEHADAAFQELRDARIESVAVPGKLVTDVVPLDLVKNIVLVEHVDPGWLLLSDDGGKTLAERTLVIIGANREWAYRYTNSKAGANGMAQFIESTYDLMVKRYPAAHLIQDHNLGMADHTNAFKAITLLFDNEMATIQSQTGVTPTRPMLAAAYNGGSTRVIQAIKKSGADWQTSDSFRPETTDYIKKYDLIAKLHIF